MGRRRAAARERRLASKHATGTTRRPWRRVGAEARTRSMACVAVPLAMAGDGRSFAKFVGQVVD
jgi:hypothetical protein